jgi:DNA polymerase-3 subunit epsilon
MNSHDCSFSGYRLVVLDAETTGLNASNDEIIEIAIIDDQGLTLIDTLIRPTRNKRWAETQSIHGITPENVLGAPVLCGLRHSTLGIFGAERLTEPMLTR